MLNLNNCFDKVLPYLENTSITTIYGEPAIGKTTLCFLYANSSLIKNKKVIYVDTEGGFSTERLKQINPNINLKNLIVFSPKNFKEQKNCVDKISTQIKNSKNIGLIIIDSLVMLYRLELGDDAMKINQQMAKILSKLNEISRNFKIPILTTNQIYSDFETKKKKMVGGSLIQYWSKTIILLEKNDEDFKYATLIKHKFLEENKIKYKIIGGGFNFR